MQTEHMNGPTRINHNRLDIDSQSSSSQKSKYGTLNECSKAKKSDKLQDYSEDDDDLDLAPYVVRKDRLIQELETSLAEMDDQIESASRLEDQKTATEDQRSSLLKEIETAVSDIQDHVLNSRELEIEKKAIENECNSLKKQVKHLSTLLNDKKDVNVKQWNYFDSLDNEETMRTRIQVLEKEIKKLRLANERMHLKEKSSKGTSGFEQLQRDNLDLQKLLQVAENSEDNIAHELATCHQTMAQMKDDFEQLEKVKGIIEEERDSLVLEKAEMEMEIKRLSEDRQNCNVIDKDTSKRFEREIQTLKVQVLKYDEHCDILEEENLAYKNHIEILQNELKATKDEQSAKAETEVTIKTDDFSSGNLKSAIIKLNKENSKLQESLEKAEQEIEELKSRLEKEQTDGGHSTAKEDKSQSLRPAFDKLNKENLQLQNELEKTEKEVSALKICLEEERDGKKTDEATPKKAEKTKKLKGLKLKDSKKSKKDKKENGITDDPDGLKDELEVLKKDMFHLQSECQALSETVTKIAGEKRSMQKQIEELNNEKAELEGKINKLETTIRKLELLKGEKQELEQKNQETELCLAQVSAELEKTVEKKNTLNGQLEKVAGEKETLVAELKEFQESLEAFKSEMDSVRKDVSAKSNEIKLLRKKHEEEKRRLIGMKDGGDKEITRIRTELREISGKVMKSTDEDIHHESTDVITTVEQLHQDIDEFSQKNSELESTKEELEKQLKDVSKQAEELQKESAKASDMAMEKAVELSRTKRSLERKIEKLTKENAEYRNRLGVATPAMSITPRMSPETIQATSIQIVESQPSPATSPRQPPPPQRSDPIRLSGARYEDSNKAGHSGLRYGSQEVSHSRYLPPGTRNEGASSRPPERSPPPYHLAKRKSLDDVMMRDKERSNQRSLPPAYPSRERRISENRNRPQSGSVVLTTASNSVGNEEEKGGTSSAYSRERRRSDGGHGYNKRISNEGERYRPDSRSSDQKSAFRPVGYRKKVVHEDYV